MQHLPHEMLIFMIRLGLLESLGSLLEASWGLLGGVLGASWRPLRGLLGPLGGLLEASWGSLGAPRGGLGAILGAFCKIVKLSSPCVALECDLEATWSRLGVVLGSSWGGLGVVLGRLGALLGSLGALLEPLGALLEASWGHLGRLRAQSGEVAKTLKNLQVF